MRFVDHVAQATVATVDALVLAAWRVLRCAVPLFVSLFYVSPGFLSVEQTWQSIRLLSHALEGSYP